QERATNHLQIGGVALPLQFTEHKNPPQQPPQLVGVRKRDPTAYTDIFCRGMMKEIADHPDEAAEHEPEDDRVCFDELAPQRRYTDVTESQRAHHAQFAEGEEGYE